jgi:STAS domain
VLFRFDAPLFFANARTFRDQVRRIAAADPRPQWIVIAAEPITDVDTTAADMLADLDEELNAAGTSLVFAELKHRVRDKLERYELIGPLNPDHFFPTLDGAIDAFRQRTGAEWAPVAEAPRPPVMSLESRYEPLATDSGGCSASCSFFVSSSDSEVLITVPWYFSSAAIALSGVACSMTMNSADVPGCR